MALQNRYFTAAFSNPKQEAPAGYSGWLVSSLFGPREQQLEQLPPISESPAGAGAMMPPPPAGGQLAVPQQQGMRKVKSAAQLRDNEDSKDEVKIIKPILTEAKEVFKPKPSELRELNFWSPTSM